MPESGQIERKLRGAWRRQRGFAHARGLCAGLLCAVLLVLFDWVADWAYWRLDLPPTGRWVLPAINLAVLGWVLYAYWWRHLARYSPLRTALAVERVHGRLDTFLVSYVQFADATADQGAVSSALMSEARRQAAEQTSGMRFGAIVDFGQLKQLAMIAAGLTLAFAAAGIWQWDHLRILLARLANPMAMIDYPRLTTVQALTGDITVKQGEPVRVEARATGTVPQNATLRVRSNGGGWDEMAVPVSGTDHFAHDFPATWQDFDYCFVANDGRSPVHHVTVVPPPRVLEAKITLRYPAYTAMPSETADAMNLKAPEDTQIEWQLRMDRPIAKVEMIREGVEAKTPVQLEENGQVIRAKAAADASSAYYFRWTDREHGYSYESPRHYIQMTPDQAPHVGITSPALDQKATLKLKLPILFWARDDFGLADASLVYSINDSHNEKKWPLESLGNKPAVEREIVWPAKDVIPDLREGDIVTFSIELTDNRAGGKPAHVVRSKALRVQFLSQEDYLADVLGRRMKYLGQIRPMYLQEREAARHVQDLGQHSAEGGKP